MGLKKASLLCVPRNPCQGDSIGSALRASPTSPKGPMARQLGKVSARVAPFWPSQPRDFFKSDGESIDFQHRRSRRPAIPRGRDDRWWGNG